jgi:glycosyltransferase involved in cell wall biosynthesis
MNQDLVTDYRVHHFSTGHIGGAGLAARRLNAGLNSIGQASFFYALAKPDFKPVENEIAIKRGLSKRIKGGIYSRLQSPFIHKTLFTPFSSSALSSRFFVKRFDNSKDIIHFHNWYNLVSLRTILDLNKKGFKVFVTLHDQRFMTAGCHYSFECTGFHDLCSKCPILPQQISPLLEIRRRKELRRFQDADGITLIAPSGWIQSQSLVSKATRAMDTRRIPNLLGPEWIKAIEIVSELRKGRPVSKILYVGIASMDPGSYIKGGDFLVKLQSFFILQESKIQIVNLRNAKDQIVDFWAKIDLLLVPSRADNSPNVILEAKSLGIPILASDVGGIPEMLQTESDQLFSLDTNSNSEILHKMLKTQDRTSKVNMIDTQLFETESLQNHLFLYSEKFRKNSEVI